MRGVLLSLDTSPGWVAAVQVLDGVSAAALGVLVPLVAADLTRGRGGFSAALGLLGLAAGAGRNSQHIPGGLGGGPLRRFRGAAGLVGGRGGGGGAAVGRPGNPASPRA